MMNYSNFSFGVLIFGWYCFDQWLRLGQGWFCCRKKTNGKSKTKKNRFVKKRDEKN